MKRTKVGVVGAALATLMALAACGSSSGGSPLSGGSAAAPSTTGGSIVVGSANFPENVLLADIYADALSAKGVKVSTKLNIGSREVYIPALKDGSIDLIPEYTGVLLQYFDKTATAVSPDDVYAALQKAVPTPLTVLDKAAAEDKDAVVVTKATADKYNLKSIADLKAVAGKLSIAGPPEWRKRQTGLPGLKAKYGVTFGKFVALDAGGPKSVNALKTGSVQAADIFTTDPNIAANGWVILDDPNSLFAAQNIVPLINSGKATDVVKTTLNGISAKLDTDTLGGLVKQVVLDKKDPDVVAKAWLSTAGL